jgi:hypothetical protein
MPFTSEILPLESESRPARWRHASWHANRQRVYDALVTTCRPAGRINAFAKCGCNATLVECDTPNADGTRRLKVRATHCHDRLCVPCGNARSAEIARCLAARTNGLALKFVTLTIAGHGEKLATKIDRLYKGFRALRLTPLWKQHIKGGAAFLEIKWSDKARRWHPHFHLICEGTYLSQDRLATMWQAITEDSFIVDIRQVKDPHQVQAYVTKYASKPLNMSFAADPGLLQEAVLSLHARRLCFAFGTWYKTRLHEIDAPDDAALGWSPIASLDSLLRMAELGDAAALAAIELAGLGRQWRRYLFPPAPS